MSQMAQRALVGVFWAMPPQLLGGTAAAAGIALINSIGNLGGFVGPALIGMLRDDVTGSYTGGLLALDGRARPRGPAGAGAEVAFARRVRNREGVNMSEPRPARRTTMGLTSDSFQSIRFSSPQRLLEVDRLMELAARVGAAGAHGGMTQIDFDWARATRQMKEELGMYVEIQTFLPREDPAVFEHAVKVAKEAGATSLRVVCLLGRRYEMFEALRTGEQPSKASTSRSPPRSRSSRSTGCRSASRTTRTGASTSRSRC